jgi:GNAT superfamily N-acetyltransferase
MVPVQYRDLAFEEAAAAADVFLVTVRDLGARHGLPVPPFTREALTRLYEHVQRTGIFQVAESDGRIVAICAATVRDDVWFLSMFWTLPEAQRRGIGRPLIERVWREGVERGARQQFVWSSIDFTATATYMKLGMLPICQIMTFAGAIERPPLAPDGYALVDLDPREVDRIDRAARGASCRQDRAFSIAAGAEGRLVVRGGAAVGYFLVNDGAIGPVAWTDEAHSRAVLGLAFRRASGRGPARIAALGIQHGAIRTALGAGLRLVSTAHLLATEKFTAFERYIPSGPALY